jgi:hypothetical protein
MPPPLRIIRFSPLPFPNPLFAKFLIGIDTTEPQPVIVLLPLLLQFRG